MLWTEPEARAADVNAIELAREAIEEADHSLHAAIYGAAGIRIKPLRERPDPTPIQAKVLDFVRNHNALWRAGAAKRRRVAPSKPEEIG